MGYLQPALQCKGQGLLQATLSGLTGLPGAIDYTFAPVDQCCTDVASLDVASLLHRLWTTTGTLWTTADQMGRVTTDQFTELTAEAVQ